MSSEMKGLMFGTLFNMEANEVAVAVSLINRGERMSAALPIDYARDVFFQLGEILIQLGALSEEQIEEFIEGEENGGENQGGLH